MSLIAPSAVLEDDVRVGEGTRVWDLTQIRSGAVIGADCVVGRNVFIDAGVVVGDRCKIQNNALLYAPAILGAGVFIGPAVVLTNDRSPRAVSPGGEVLAAEDWRQEGVEVLEGAAIGAGALVVGGSTVGAWSLVGAGAVVVADVPPFALVVGIPARRVGWVGRAGARLEETAPGTLRCPATGVTFVDHGDHVEEIR